MCFNVKNVEDISVEALNADLPRGLTFKSFTEKIGSKAHQTEIIGEL